MLGLKADSELRYQLFLKKIKETGKVYLVSDGESAAMFPSQDYVLEDDEYVCADEASDDSEPANVVPFWSNRAYPTQWLKQAEEDLEIVELDLQQFFNILCHYEELGAPVGIEWNQHGVGLEIMASTVLDEVEKLIDSNI